MTTDAGTPGTDAPAPPPTEATPGGPLRLTRSRSDRKLAGVCGGLGAYTGVDPVVFRVVIAVSALLGGVGLVAYVLAWIVVPEAPDGPERAVSRSQPARLDLVALVVVGLAALHLLSQPWGRGGFRIDFAPLLLIGAAIWWWRRDRDQRPVNHDVTPTTIHASGGDVPADQLVGSSAAPDPAAARLPRLTFSAVVLTAGVFATLAAAGVAVNPTVALATCLLVAAVGLVASAWYGTRGGLIALCAILAVATIVSSVVSVPLRGGVGERTWNPSSAAELRDRYRLGAGEARLDLTQLDDLDEVRRVKVSVGVGELRVLVPAGIAVDVTARAGLGDLRILGRDNEGVGAEVDRSVDGDGDSEGRLVLDLQVGAGEIRVDR